MEIVMSTVFIKQLSIELSTI